NLKNLNTTSQNSKIELTRLNSSILFQDVGAIILPSILFSSTQGRSDFIKVHPSAEITINGDLEARHNLNIKTGLKLRNFIFTPGVNIGFLSGAMYEMNTMIGDGNCNSYISLFSTPGGAAARFINQSGFELNYIQIRDINLTGATANLVNSLKFGQTNGWNVLEKTNETFYWIGRNGNWSNPSNWSLNSGGPAAV
ncbi:MAG TPA: hypothetical protein PKD85_07640, partial [Saprospiraceae bacterium]|nr:hypothetical protein [Saprospiraceae bacterium]